MIDIFAVAGGDCCARFKNLKDTFMRNLRKVQESKTSGSGTDDLYKPKWNLFSNLKFLQKTCVQTGSVSNIETQPSSDSSQTTIVDLEAQSQVAGVYYDETLQVSFVSLKSTFLLLLKTC